MFYDTSDKKKMVSSHKQDRKGAATTELTSTNNLDNISVPSIFKPRKKIKLMSLDLKVKLF